jgi:shikimate dehydrogenase
MTHFGLIGYPLGHSFSPVYFSKKFKTIGLEATYKAYPILSIEEFPRLISKIPFAGMNVTIPYKEAIIPYLDDIDENALKTGAVNTIAFKDGKTKGYNTDIHGFEQSLLNWIPDMSDIKQALVLGSGGASKAVTYVLNKNNISYFIISRSPIHDFTYGNLPHEIFTNTQLIINTTPLGMTPWQDKMPDLPYNLLNDKIFLYDLVYNPEISVFLGVGLARGCKIKNGREMLTIQAEYAWNIWNSKEI